MAILERGCAACNSKLNPTSERQNENHFSVRFDDADQVGIFKDGQMVEGVVEAVVGIGGWALIELGNPGEYDAYGIVPHKPGLGMCGCRAIDGAYGLTPRVLIGDNGYEARRV